MPNYPRQTMKRIMRQAEGDMRVSRDADVLVRWRYRRRCGCAERVPNACVRSNPGQMYVAYVAFLRELAQEAGKEAEADGDPQIVPRHIQRAMPVRACSHKRSLRALALTVRCRSVSKIGSTPRLLECRSIFISHLSWTKAAGVQAMQIPRAGPAQPVFMYHCPQQVVCSHGVAV